MEKYDQLKMLELSFNLRVFQAMILGFNLLQNTMSN